MLGSANRKRGTPVPKEWPQPDDEDPETYKRSVKLEAWAVGLALGVLILTGLRILFGG